MPFVSKTAIVFGYLELAQNQTQGTEAKTEYLLLQTEVHSLELDFHLGGKEKMLPPQRLLTLLECWILYRRQTSMG